MREAMMPDDDRTRLVEEAADIFLRLSHDPENATLQEERDAFLARGQTAKDAYAHVLRAWKGTGVKKGRNNSQLLIAFLAIMGFGLYVVREPVHRYFVSDYLTAAETESIVLASGDVAALDARSALIDGTDDTLRRVTLLAGSAVFEVSSDARPFIVMLEDLHVRVVGTTFEVSQIGDALQVSVIEGQVQAGLSGITWELDAGDSLLLADDAPAVTSEVAINDIAAWRRDRFVADGLAFAQVARIIERRLPGRVIVYGSTLAKAPMAGTIDLTNPELALQTLAAARDARVITLGPLLTLVMP